MIETAHAAGVIEDAPRVSEILIHVFEFLLSIVGILGIIGLVVSGAMYLLASGDESLTKKAKAAFQASVIGLVVAFGSWIIVMTLQSFFS